MTAPETESRTEAAPEESRRRLIKRLALVAATGYLAPKAVMISEPWACHRDGHPPNPGNPSGPFC